MEYGHTLAKDGVTSVKVHHAPGGGSSFSLGHDMSSGADDRFGHVKKGQDEKIDPATMQVAGGATAALDAEKGGKDTSMQPMSTGLGEPKDSITNPAQSSGKNTHPNDSSISIGGGAATEQAAVVMTPEIAAIDAEIKEIQDKIDNDFTLSNPKKMQMKKDLGALRAKRNGLANQ